MAEFFPNIPKIEYDPKSKNPLTFKHYNPDEIIEGQKMKDLFRFSVCLLAHFPWHRLRSVRLSHSAASVG